MLYDILKDFKGSQDGRYCESFEAGTQAELSDYLAEMVVPLGQARPVNVKKIEVESSPEPEIDNKAVITNPRGRKAK